MNLLWLLVLEIANSSNYKLFSLIEPSVSLSPIDANKLCVEKQLEIAIINNDKEWDEASDICTNDIKCWIKFRYKNISSIPNQNYEQYLSQVFVTATEIPEEWCGILNDNQLIMPYDCHIPIPTSYLAEIPSILCQREVKIIENVPTHSPTISSISSISSPNVPSTQPNDNNSNDEKSSESEDDDTNVSLSTIIIIVILVILFLVGCGILIMWTKHNKADHDQSDEQSAETSNKDKRENEDNNEDKDEDKFESMARRNSDLKKYDGFSDDDFYHDIDDGTSSYNYDSSTF